MKAIFTGTIQGGFGIAAVVEDHLADDAVMDYLATVALAEAIDIQHPNALEKNARQDAGGENFVVYSTGIGSGCSIFGPFADRDVAEEFAEDNRSDEDEWALFTCERLPSHSLTSEP